MTNSSNFVSSFILLFLLVGNTDIIIYGNTDKIVVILIKKLWAEFRKQKQGLTWMEQTIQNKELKSTEI